MLLTAVSVVAAMSILVTGCGSSSGSSTEATAAAVAEAEAEADEDAADVGEAAVDVEWPTGTVTWEIAAGAGGGTDNMGRIITNYLGNATGEAFSVINDDTGNGTVAYETVRNAKPDGYTVLFYHSTLPIQYYQGIYGEDPSDPDNFTVIASIVNGGDGDVLCVPANAPYDTLQELVDYCKEHPGEVTFGNQNGGFGQLEALLFADRADIDINCVDSGGQADSIIALLGGNIDATFIGLDAAVQYEEDGDMKLLGICNEERSKNAPDVPTFKEQGYDVVFKSDMFLFGPAGMDPALVEVMNATIQGAASDEDVISGLANFNNGYIPMGVEESQNAWQEVCATIKEMCDLAGYDVSDK